GPLGPAGMVLRGIGAHGENDVGVLDVDPAVGHRTAAERGGQTGHRGTVSNSCLRVPVWHPEGADRLPLEVVELVGVGATADPGDAGGAVHHLAAGVLRDEGPIARVLDVPRDALHRLVPGDVLPAIGPGTSYVWPEDAIGVGDVVLEVRAVRAHGAA